MKTLDSLVFHGMLSSERKAQDISYATMIQNSSDKALETLLWMQKIGHEMKNNLSRRKRVQRSLEVETLLTSDLHKSN